MPPQLCSGEIPRLFALTEPDTGSDAANQKTQKGTAVDGGWTLNGSKMWDLQRQRREARLVTQTDPSLGQAGVASGFLVDNLDQDCFVPSPSTGRWHSTLADTASIALSTTASCPTIRSPWRSARASRSR
ncbi:acyl-CoA dehydrogenase family protein [Conexibacter sp. W3-3-2]|uniref:acyl-CoA dehydrogenase family protein n=1 Tax=Conexibacter sp. W3-3-2 TaxID=2675227 RepID=UPI0035C908FD